MTSFLSETIPEDFQTSILKLNSCLSIEKFDHFSHLLLDEKRVNRFRHKSLEHQKCNSHLEYRKRQFIEELFHRLRDRLPKERSCLRLAHVLPFDVQPIIVLLRGDCDQLNANLDKFFLREGMYENCISVNVLHSSDYSLDDWTQLTATASLRNRLLDRLGFRVIGLDYKRVIKMFDNQDFNAFVRTLI